MVNEVLQTVIEYLKLPHTDYAILINGPWGCGKTYFWKNMVESSLRNEDETLCHPLYASFYGCENIKDIDSQLFLASYPDIKGKLAGKLSTAGGNILKQLFKKYTSLELPSINFRWFIRTKNSVICFDDLERSNLPFKEVLGYINTFVEHEGVKVVILCNEKAIDTADFELYKKMKEKVIGNSLDYKPDYKSVLSTLMDEHQDQKEFHDFLIKNTVLILHLFESSETDNLRSLRRAITTLNMVFKTIQEGGVDPNQLAEQLIYAVAPTAFELYGRAANTEKLKSIHAMDYMSLSGISMRGLRRDESAEKTYEEKFNDRYFSQFGFLDMGNAIGCPSICDYMITGYLDKGLLLEWAAKLTKIPDEKEERIKHLMFNAREMDDNEFENTALQVLGYIESGDMNEINTYVRLYPHFEWYVDEGVIALTKGQLFEKFKTGLTKANEGGTLQPYQHLRHEIDLPMNKPMSEECQTFGNYVLAINEQIFEKQRSDRTKKLSFEDEPQAFIDSLVDSGESGFLLTPIFQELNADTTAKQILLLPNALKSRFGMVMHKRYLKYQPQSEYIVELPVLIGIREVIKDYCEKSSEGLQIKPMSLLLTQAILKNLDQIIDSLQKLKKPLEESQGIAEQPEKQKEGGSQ